MCDVRDRRAPQLGKNTYLCRQAEDRSPMIELWLQSSVNRDNNNDINDIAQRASGICATYSIL